jgi:hypothetical protein
MLGMQSHEAYDETVTIMPWLLAIMLGKKCFGRPVQRQCIDVEGEANITRRSLKDCLASGHAGIVNDYCWMSNLALDFLCHFFQLLG